MKKFVKHAFVCLLATVLVLGLLAGCGSSTQETPAETKNSLPPKQTTEAPETTPAPETKTDETDPAAPSRVDEFTEGNEPAPGWRIGLGVVTNVNGSKDAGDADGLAKGYFIAASILLDEFDVIRDCVIDALQTSINFDTTGQVTTDPATVFLTKNQLGKDYGLHQVSSLGKEWNEQAEEFAQFCIGKTVEEVMGIQLVDKKAVDTVSGVTIKVNDFIAAIGKANILSVPADDSANSQLHLLISTDISGSKNAADGKDGRAEVYTTYVAAAVDGNGMITGCFIDASQARVSFDGTGKITSDINAEVLTKDELGDNYGMRAVSSLGKEWGEQALSFAQYCHGKTVSQIVGLTLDGGHAVDADVLSCATISIDGWLALLAQLQ